MLTLLLQLLWPPWVLKSWYSFLHPIQPDSTSLSILSCVNIICSPTLLVRDTQSGKASSPLGAVLCMWLVLVIMWLFTKYKSLVKRNFHGWHWVLFCHWIYSFNSVTAAAMSSLTAAQGCLKPQPLFPEPPLAAGLTKGANLTSYTSTYMSKREINFQTETIKDCPFMRKAKQDTGVECTMGTCFIKTARGGWVDSKDPIAAIKCTVNV